MNWDEAKGHHARLKARHGRANWHESFEDLHKVPAAVMYLASRLDQRENQLRGLLTAAKAAVADPALLPQLGEIVRQVELVPPPEDV